MWGLKWGGSSWTLHECKFEICQASVDLWPRMKIKSTVKPQLSQGVKCIIVPLCQSNNFPLDLELKIKHWTSVQTVAVSRINHENIGKKNLISSKHACNDSHNIFFSLSRLQIAFTTPVLGWTEYSLLYRSDSDLDILCNVRCDFDCRYTAGTKFEVKCISLQRHWQNVSYNCKYSMIENV